MMIKLAIALDGAHKDQKKFAPFADVVEIKSKTKLSEHYRILAEVLNEIRKNDETSWVWNKAKNELNYLSRTVEKNLAEYNVEGRGTVIVMDSVCGDFCNFICGITFGSLCVLASGGLGVVLCATGSAIGCVIICAQACKEYPNLPSMTLSAACGTIFAVCCKMIKMSPACEKVNSQFRSLHLVKLVTLMKYD